MDTILALTLKQCAQLDAKDAAALLNPVSPQKLDLNAAMQLLNPRNANTFPELSFNDPTTMFLLNSLLSNSLQNPFSQSLLSNTNAVNDQNLDAPPNKKQCLESTSSVQPTSPSNTASTSSCVSAISPQQCQSPWPSLKSSLQSSFQSASQSPRKAKRKAPSSVPDEKKDEAYYERRKKNNDAAKRSRDARRMKEEHTASRAVGLEQENTNLRNEIATLKSEITKLRVLILANPSTGLVKPQPLSIGHHNEPSSSSD